MEEIFMYICTNCKETLEVAANFCPKCGAPMVEQQPAPVAPAYEAQPAAPVYEAQPAAPAYEAPEQPTFETTVLPHANEVYSAPAQPVYEQPVYSQPQAETYDYTQPQYPMQPEPAPQGSSKKKNIIGMILSISGISISAFSLLYSLIFLAASSSEYEMGLAAFIFGIIMFCVSFPLSLIGLLLSKNKGEPNTFAKVGKILGIIGLIISGLILLFGFIGLINYNSYVPSYSPNYDLDLNDYYF